MVLKKLKALLSRGSKRLRPETTNSPPIAETETPPPAMPAVHRGPEVVHHPVALQDLDPDAVRIVRRLARFDYTAYLVGGCVRDLLLELNPKDFDIATSATPRQVKRLFSNCRIIGRRFRLAHVYFQNGKIVEVATFRARDAADNGPELPEPEPPPAAVDDADDLLIRDDNVFGTPEEDALRRDFTINALFYDVNAETVIDHADGLGDLRRRLVRTIGDPIVRFREDPIRILRAIKFAARLDFTIEAKTLAALRQTRSEIPKAAAPRILEEFNRFCRSGAGKRSFALAFETGVFEVILPELSATYGEGGPERRILFALLDAIDARWKSGRDVYPGEIFSALLFCAVAPGLGLTIDPKSAAKRDGRDGRTQVDDALRPIAVRLRIARKDQEHTRQALTTLARIVPLKPMRRGAKVALMRRPAFGDAMAMLEALAPVLGGEFAAARTAWSESLAGHGAAAAASPGHADSAESHPADDAPPPSEGGRGKRRRGRRGGRGRRKDRTSDVATSPELAGMPTPSPAQPPAPATVVTARGPKLPPVWDDNYFFAALPSVPTHVGTDDETDSGRYGGGVVPVTDGVPDDKPSPSGRKRRRGGRRHRGGGPTIPPSSSSSGTEGDAS
jgi:poly(A) polymerase